jgi:hypothetical protein
MAVVRWWCLAACVGCALGARVSMKVVASTPSIPATPRPSIPVPHRPPHDPLGPTELLPLAGSCAAPLRHTNFEYVVCPFRNVTQRDVVATWNAFHGILGLWGTWKTIATDGGGAKYDAMHYTDGTECGAKRRSAVVKVSCGAAFSVLEVSEPTTCEYVLTLQAPQVCTADFNVRAVSVSASPSPSPGAAATANATMAAASSSSPAPVPAASAGSVTPSSTGTPSPSASASAPLASPTVPSSPAATAAVAAADIRPDGTVRAAAGGEGGTCAGAGVDSAMLAAVRRAQAALADLEALLQRASSVEGRPSPSSGGATAAHTPAPSP